jgi:hypothetical protein
MQLKLSIPFDFLVLYIQKHIRKYKHTHPSFFLLMNLYIYTNYKYLHNIVINHKS